ncbi:DUF1643 domain-containing protein [Bacillus altitudinis]|uniref:DUF1643 domain-containing protein n=1 Tax=Bacillus safensis TaxID=561879 RepID=A0A5C0WGL6_BACIA|nr:MULTISPECIES: DUF1643 domain-containing protein [Bacillus]QEK63378.1 hypothetical protein FX981_01619 [Bacillus safensis]QII26829.1 DUF1643 domain-containing protein [Bacillus altitudinis]
MKLIKNMIRTEVIYDDDLNNKFLIKKEWNQYEKKAVVIMKKAGRANAILLDHTTMYVMNNLFKLGYGSVNIVNLFPTIKGKETKESITTNMKCIKEAVRNSDDVIIAIGKGADINKRALKRLDMILALLLDNKANVLEIESSSGRRGFHPLYPALKNQWKLVPYSREKV